jgi:hypothetical protein
MIYDLYSFSLIGFHKNNELVQVVLNSFKHVVKVRFMPHTYGENLVRREESTSY